MKEMGEALFPDPEKPVSSPGSSIYGRARGIAVLPQDAARGSVRWRRDLRWYVRS